MHAFAIFDSFDTIKLNERDDFLKITNDQKTVIMGHNNLLKKNIYGLNVIDADIDGNNTFSWKLRIDDIKPDDSSDLLHWYINHWWWEMFHMIINIQIMVLAEIAGVVIFGKMAATLVECYIILREETGLMLF